MISWPSWLSKLTELLAALLKAAADRVAPWIERRKPKLYVHPILGNMLWCIAQQPRKDGPPLEMMQITFWAHINHDDSKQALVIVDAYPVGTKPQITAMQKFKIPPGAMVKEQVSAFVVPILAEQGKPWTGRIVLVDQFQRKYKTKKMTFEWAGP